MLTQLLHKYASYMTVIDNKFCLRMGAVHRPEPCFCHHTWVE